VSAVIAKCLNRTNANRVKGVDDTIAMLLALSASPEELDVAMISVTYGNVPLQRCTFSSPDLSTTACD
jgi:inosine-uridine nucleoside N-ribohydrolase